MLIFFDHLHPSLTPKTLADFTTHPFSLPKTLPTFHCYSSRVSISRIRTSLRTSTSTSQTLPHTAIHRIAEKLRSLGFTETSNSRESKPSLEEKSAGEIFIPLPDKLPKYRVGHTLDPSWSTPEYPVPRPGSGRWISRVNELKGEVKRCKEEERVFGKKEKEVRVPTLAELKLTKTELKRLQTVGIRLTTKLKVGKAGITEGIVNGIHERWRKEEVVKVVCEDLCRMNMKNTHYLLERKTGGLVVWRSGSKILLYRGANYKYPYFQSKNLSNGTPCDNLPMMDSQKDVAKSSGSRSNDKLTQSTLIKGVGMPNRVRFQLPGEAELAEEADRLLDGLGPRFTDWWGYDPQPVDADLLPAMLPGYRRPFRLLPYGVNPKLTGDEMNILRRLGRPLPCHFALGRNKKLQGLAAAIVKLWEKCEVAKIAVKRGVQNTNSEMMAEELKWLTGGTLIGRDREFIVLYRGKDFLPPAVSTAIEERRYGMQTAKQMTVHVKSSINKQDLHVGSGCEENHVVDNSEGTFISQQNKLRSNEATIKRTNLKLSDALEKKSRAENLLMKLEKAVDSRQSEIDKEGITEEERQMLRRVGLKMKPFLLMGRRGVFDGTVENMHLHWKYRELVKLICSEKSVDAVHQVARTLESESAGILIAVERVRKGHAIIMYRGKNYRRPSSLRPATLLNKKEALKRSIEAQRRESLKLHVLKLTGNINELELQLSKDKEAHKLQSNDDLTAQKVKEEMNDMQTDSGLIIAADHQSYLKLPANEDENEEDKLKPVADLISPSFDDGMGAAINIIQATQQGETDSSSICEVGKAEPDFSHHSISEVTDYKGIRHSAVTDAGHLVFESNAISSSDESIRNKSMENKQIEIASTSLHLSNKERLLLRRQALKMKKRPPFALGKSNVVSGIAKTLKGHFERHPLAIVNVKGRAKGTSVQEVVFKLEQATGAVLVSQEPCKVILYRGWGAGEQPGQRNTSMEKKNGNTHAISSELLAAIRLECGLQS